MGKQSEKCVIQRLKKAEKRVKALDKLVDVLEKDCDELKDAYFDIVERHFDSPIAREMRREYVDRCVLDERTAKHGDLLASVKDDSYSDALRKWSHGVILGWRHPDTMTEAQFKLEFEKEFRNELACIFSERMRELEERESE